jgi:hypothetical protein
MHQKSQPFETTSNPPLVCVAEIAAHKHSPLFNGLAGENVIVCVCPTAVVEGVIAGSAISLISLGFVPAASSTIYTLPTAAIDAWVELAASWVKVTSSTLDPLDPAANSKEAFVNEDRSRAVLAVVSRHLPLLGVKPKTGS